MTWDVLPPGEIYLSWEGLYQKENSISWFPPLPAALIKVLGHSCIIMSPIPTPTVELLSPGWSPAMQLLPSPSHCYQQPAAILYPQGFVFQLRISLLTQESFRIHSLFGVLLIHMKYFNQEIKFWWKTKKWFLFTQFYVPLFNVFFPLFLWGNQG